MATIATFDYRGYSCRIAKNPIGVWLGYCTLPEGHPDIGKDYNDVDVKVHGGLTYGEGATFGFDCGHFGDFVPELSLEGHEWTEDEVRKEIKTMVDQFIGPW